jgi:TP901 family phage tail tape measure protein
MYAIDIGLNDLFTANFGQLKSNALAGINSLQDKLKSAFKFDMSGFSTARNSIDQLRQKIDTLTQNRNSATDFGIVKGLNKEISQAQKELQRLENMGTNTNPLTKLKNDAIMAVPALGLVANPIVASSLALSGATSMAANFEQGMAKINSTLQLDTPQKLQELSNKLLDMGKNSSVDINRIPDAFEKIVSATGNADKSLSILNASLKASKASFTDVSIISDATAGILANFPKLKDTDEASAKYATDIILKTKNLGKAEAGDLAKYLPQLLPDAKNLGISVEEVGASIALLTSKGVSMEKTTVYMENMMKALGDQDKILAFQKLGVKFFEIGENGKRVQRPLLDIVSSMNQVFSKMDDVQKLQAFDGIGLDKEQKTGFSILMQDIPEYTKMTKGMREAEGETERTLAKTGNTIDNITQFTNQLKAVFMQLGAFVLPVVNVGLQAINTTFKVLTSVYNWFYDKSNLLIPIVGILTGMVVLWNFSMLTSVATIGLLNGIFMIFNGLLVVYNFLMSINPVVAVVIAIIALSAALVLAYENIGWFKDAVDGTFSFMKSMVNMVIEDVNWLITKIREGLEWMGIMNKEKRLKDEAEQKTIAEREEARKQDDISQKGISGMLADNERQKEKAKKDADLDKSVHGTGSIFDISKAPKEKAGANKLSLGTFGVEGDTRQAKNITVNVQTLGGIKEIKIMVGDASEVTPELKQKINDGVREALIGSVRDFEIMY